MHINLNNPNDRTPAFGVKIDGSIATDLCKEIYVRKMSQLTPAYIQQFERLRSCGLDTSEIYLARGAKTDVFTLKNPSISTAYEKPLVEAEKGNLLEAWFKIRPEQIKNAETTIKEAIDEKRRGLAEMAKNVIVRGLLYTKNNEKDVAKSIEKMDDDTVIDLFYRAKDITQSKEV